MGKHGFGVDIGGSGIKGAPVDLRRGKLAEDRFRVPTPQPATPEAVAATVREVLDHFKWDGVFGCTFPAVVQHGLVRTAANVDPAWIGTDAHKLLGKVTGRDVLVVNDADAAGLAEVRFGAAKDQDGVVLVSTLGTGIGSALVVDGRLVPNTELGHVEIDGCDAESRAADSAREREDLSWDDWAARLTRYFQRMEALFWPDLIVVGGGVSKDAEQFLPLLKLKTRIVPAQLENKAGIIGAAHLAAHK
jgi:polyphosphate glucokinase